MRLHRATLLSIANHSLELAQRLRSGPARGVAILKAQACVAAASLPGSWEIGEHAPDALPWVDGAGDWPRPGEKEMT